MATVTKVMNHSKYQAKTKNMTDSELRYVIKDCRAVINLQKDFNPNCSYYADEIHYCAMELYNRKNKNN